MRPLATSASSRPTPTPTPPAAPPPAAAALPSSPWHSPVPYLFGGLAAMLALITLALLILACSYWKLNNYLGTGGGDAVSSAPGATDGGGGSKTPAAAAAASPAVFSDLVAVVMAGEKTPTFLAAPIVRQARGNNSDDTAAGEEGSPETEDQEKHRGTAGEGESGAVADDTERDRQLDHV